MRTGLVNLNIDRGMAYLGLSSEFEIREYGDQCSYGSPRLHQTSEVWPTLECLVSLTMGYMRTGLVILNMNRGFAYLGVSGEFEYGLFADQFGYPKH